MSQYIYRIENAYIMLAVHLYIGITPMSFGHTKGKLLTRWWSILLCIIVLSICCKVLRQERSLCAFYTCQLYDVISLISTVFKYYISCSTNDCIIMIIHAFTPWNYLCCFVYLDATLLFVGFIIFRKLNIHVSPNIICLFLDSCWIGVNVSSSRTHL